MSAIANKQPVIHLAASAGGHLDLLGWIRDAFEGYDCVWVVPGGPRADQLAASGAPVSEIPDTGRHLRTIYANVRSALGTVVKQRPRLVVTTGAGCVVPFALLARLTGARVIFIETMARVTTPSKSGRVLSMIAGDVFVQWPEMSDIYPGAVVCRPALCEEVSAPADAGQGTFVAVGTHCEPFDRMLRLVDDAVEAGLLPGPVHAQTGVSKYRPRNFEATPWMDPEEIDILAAQSRYVICHAGSGLISSALRAGRRPLVLARRHQHGEHFDDHQLQLTSRLSELGLIVQLDGGITEADLREAEAGPSPANIAETLPSVQGALTATLAGISADPGLASPPLAAPVP